MDMHPVQAFAVGVMVVIGLPIAGVFGLGFFMCLFPNAIDRKGEHSRLIRWPRAINAFWLESRMRRWLKAAHAFMQEFSEYIGIISNGHRARKFMREMWQSDT